MTNTWPPEGDRPLLQSLVDRIHLEAGHVALIGHDMDAVDDLGQRLVQALRQDAGLEVLVLFDPENDALIGRINQRLTPLSLEDARRPDRSPWPAQVWVLRARTTAQSRQLETLARMVRDFPAVNLRLLVLVAPGQADALLAGALGRTFLPWRLSDPVPLAADDDELAPAVSSSPAHPSHPARMARAPVRAADAQTERRAFMDKVRAGLRHPPDPALVATIAVTLLLASLLVRCS